MFRRCGSGLALTASLISIWVGISVALIEIMVGAVAGNTIGLTLAPWVNYLAGFGAILLTFLAGAEIDAKVVRKNLWSSLSIGVMGFFAPYLGVLLFARFVADWPWPQAQIAGISLSTTSVAVVYAVMVETGLNKTEIGKIILAACFINDLGTVLALGLIFANYNVWLAAFAGATAVSLWFLPRFSPWFFSKVGHRVSEPETKFIALDPVLARRHGEHRRQRGGAAGLPRRHGAGADVPEGPGPRAPDAGGRLHHPDAVLLPEGGLARGLSGRDRRRRPDRRVPGA